MADDDPELLRLIASRLELALGEVTARLAGKSEQDALWDGEAG